MESLYQQMLQTLAEKGFSKHPAQTPLEYAIVAYQHHSPATAEVYVAWTGDGVNGARSCARFLQVVKILVNISHDLCADVAIAGATANRSHFDGNGVFSLYFFNRALLRNPELQLIPMKLS